MYVVWRIDVLAGGFKIQDEQVVEAIGVGLHRVMQVPGRVRLL